MELITRSIIYPEGDTHEIEHTLRINEYVDLNGNPLAVPLSTLRVIAYRVYKMTTQTGRGFTNVKYHLELVRRPELRELIDHRGGEGCS